MKKKTINLITNILAILTWIVALVLPFLYEVDIKMIAVLILGGLIALNFKNEKLSNFIDKLLKLKE